MRTFEHFITEAAYLLDIEDRVKSGQITPEQARLLYDRRSVRAHSRWAREAKEKDPNRFALALRPKPAEPAPAEPQPVIKPNNDLGPVVKRKPIPNHLALSTKVKDPKVAEVQQQRNKILGQNSNRANIRFRRGLKNLAGNLLKKQTGYTGLETGSNLGGPKRFGPETR